MANGSREARRRRILEGGQDRLALIAGRKQTLDSLPDSSQIPHLHNPDSLLPTQQSAAPRNGEETLSNHTPPKHDNSTEHQSETFSNGRKDDLLSVKSEPQLDPSQTPCSDANTEPESSSSASTMHQHSSRKIFPSDIFNSNQINSAMSTTGCTRMLCSITMALLVVLSYSGFPIFGTKIMRSIILFRPLFLVFLTNVTFILWKLLSEKQKASTRGERNAIKSPSAAQGADWTEEAGRVLELGLMMQRFMGSVFMECSVYAVIVICGLSLFG